MSRPLEPSGTNAAGILSGGGVRVACALVLVLVLVVPVSAQYTKTEPPRSPYRFGPIRFTPRLALVNAGRDTNPQVSATAPMEDGSVTVRGSAEGFVPFKDRVRLIGEAWLDWSYYQREDAERSIDPGGRGRAEVDVGPVTLMAGGGGLQARQLYSMDIDERVLRQEVFGYAGAELRLHRLTSLSGGAELRTYRFDPTSRSGEGSPVASLNLDRNAQTGRVALRRKLTPLTTLVGSAEVLEDRFAHAPESLRTTRSFRYLGGLELGEGAVIVGRFMAGLRDFPASSSGSLPAYRGPAYLAEGVLPLFGRARLVGGVTRDVYVSSTAARSVESRNRNAYTLLQLRATLEAELALGIIGRAGTTYGRSDYLLSTVTGGVSSPRADNLYTASLSMLRHITDGLRAGGTVTYSRRVSTIPGYSYDRWIYGISAEYVPPPPRR